MLQLQQRCNAFVDYCLSSCYSSVGMYLEHTAETELNTVQVGLPQQHVLQYKHRIAFRLKTLQATPHYTIAYTYRYYNVHSHIILYALY